MSAEFIKRGDLVRITGKIAIIMAVDDRDVYFVYLNRHVAGTANHEVWSTNRKAIRKGMVISA